MTLPMSLPYVVGIIGKGENSEESEEEAEEI
jgi:hypothetical protein